MSLAILFHLLCFQHVLDINITIIRNLRLFCWITTLVVLFLVRCVLEIRCGWVGVVSVLQATRNTDTTPTQPHRNSNTHRTKNNTTNVVIQENSRKLLMIDILMSERCWAHKKWNKIASDIKLVFYSSTNTNNCLHIVCILCLYTVSIVCILWTSDRPVTETSTSQHTTPTTDIHAPGAIRTTNPSKRTTANPRLRPGGLWNQYLHTTAFLEA